jgi:hypothetical protein
MTGGRRREDEFEPLSFPRDAVRRSSEELELDEALMTWQRAAVFRREANRVLRAYEVSFEALRVIHAVDWLCREKDDCVSQLEVATHLDLAATSVSVHVWALGRRGFLSVGLDATGQCYRIFVDTKGEELLAVARSSLLLAARETGLVSGVAWCEVG